MSIKTKDGFVGVAKKGKSSKKPKDMRPTVDEYDAKEEVERERMMQRVAHDLCRRERVVDLGCLTKPINVVRGDVVATEDLAVHMQTPDNKVLTEVRLDSMAVTRHGIAYMYHVTIENRVAGEVKQFTVTTTEEFSNPYSRLRKDVPSVGEVITTINEKKFELLSKYHHKTLYDVKLAPERGMRWDD